MADQLCFYGFTDGMDARLKGIVESRLSSKTEKGRKYTKVSHEGEVYSFPEYCRKLTQECVSFDSSSANGKTVYLAVLPNDSYYPLTKTQYDFCIFLKEHGFDNNEKAAAYKVSEAERKEAQAKAEEAARESAKQEIEKAGMVKAQFDKEMLLLQKEVSDKYPAARQIAENFMDKRNIQPEMRQQIMVRLMRLPAILLNYQRLSQNPDYAGICTSIVQSYTETHNKCSRKLFHLFTGITLPKNNRDTKEAVDKWLKNPIISMTTKKKSIAR
jgi:hypothetical protein